MTKLFVITGHGKYAAGVESSLKLLLGQSEGMFFIDFEENDSDTDLREKFLKVLNENQGAEVLFVCDLLGGTPYKVAAQLANDSSNLEVVAGCNIGSIMEAFMARDDHSIQDLADFIVDVSKKFTVKFQKVKASQEIEQRDESSEGI